MIRHCIINTNTNVVVNIIDYETEQTGIPTGLAEHLLCIKSDKGEIGGTYENGVITNLSKPEPILLLGAV
jgi:hypothetical protein